MKTAVVAAMAAVAGVVAAFAGAAPTGTPAADVVLVVLGVSMISAAASLAPWWSVIGVAGVAAVTVVDPVLAAIAGLAFVTALWLGAVRRADLGEARLAIAAIVANVLIRSELDLFFGASALVGVVAGSVVLVTGALRCRRSPVGRVLVGGVAVTLCLGAFAVVLFAASTLSARQALRDANTLARRGMDHLAAGEVGAAQRSFAASAGAFARVDRAMDAPWTQPARVVPVVAQHRDALDILVSEASISAAAIAAELDDFDLDRLRLRDGRIDLVAVSELNGPLEGLQAALVELRGATVLAGNPWLTSPVQRRLDDLEADIDAQEERGEIASEALGLAPAMLGAEGERTYLVVFTTPVEARGHGGFLGNWAELTVDDGRITLSGFGRNDDLNRGGSRPRTVTGPEEWLARYGPFGFTSAADGTVGEVPWLNITMSPHFPSTAQVIAELYPQSGGRAVDGVFALDIETMVALLTFTGPIAVDGVTEPLSSENAVEYLLLDQYLSDSNEQRLDVLEDVALATIEELLGGALPGPAELARTLGPMASEGRLTAFAVAEEEQALFERIGMAGALPDPEGGDGLVIALNNASGNKIDNFLDVDIEYSVAPDSSTGSASARLTVVMSNSSPEVGLPDYVIGNLVGLPIGTNQTWLTVYSMMPVTSATLDGEPLDLDVRSEAGYLASAEYIVLPPRSRRIVEFELGGPLALEDLYRLAVRTPAAVRPFPTVITVEQTDGTTAVSRLDRPGTARIDVPLGSQVRWP